MPTPNELELMGSSSSDAVVATESTPLLQADPAAGHAPRPVSRREKLYRFLEAQTKAGRRYEAFIVVLIVLNVAAFILGSLFLPQYNDAPWAQRDTGLCNNLCDTLWFGNFADNGLGFLGIGATSVLELVTVAVFSVEYIARLTVADLEDPSYAGFWGRCRYVFTFFSLVDLASTVPFYIDSFVLKETDLQTSAFLRMFRLLRMARVEGRYDTALTLIDDVFRRQRGMLGTALFIGVTTWLTVSSFYYLAERRNLDMVYCGGAGDICEQDTDDIDTSLCVIDEWGLTNCTAAGCPGTDEVPEPCYNLYNSIPMACYFALLNLFGEFPLMEQHSVGGKIVGTLTAVVAVAVFALPVGIVGNGMESVIAERRQLEQEAGGGDDDDDGDDTARLQREEEEHSLVTPGFRATDSTRRGRMYNLLFSQTERGSAFVDHFINVLIVTTAISFMIDTVSTVSRRTHVILDCLELFAVIVFTIEYVLRVWSIQEDPRYRGPRGIIKYMTSFLPMVDLLSFAPYWLEVLYTRVIITPYSDASNTWSNLVKSLRLLRIFRFERYTHAFLSFEDVISRNLDVLSITAFTALLFWVFFAAFLYVTERNNPDPDMASFYSTVPNSMWVTLLNLSGESPLCQYSAPGRWATGILGLFATGIFGIPIGILGAGFEEILEEEHEDNTEELEDAGRSHRGPSELGGPVERWAYNLVNGFGSKFAKYFEATIYCLILLVVAVGVWQTLPGQENAFHEIEWTAVVIFSFEYLLRLIGAGADPDFAPGRNAVTCRLRFMVSFYSIIDLLAIVPFYVVYALPNSVVNKYDEYLRMLRILRLLKLDKYVPSITLIDDVIRLKFASLRVAFYAAITLWVIFSSILFLCEHKDYRNDIDEQLPLYGCDEDCTMSDRFQNFFDSSIYTGVHLTGDYPIITYSWPGRFTNFFMVIAAVGVVSIPSGLIASGFVEIVQSKNHALKGEVSPGHHGRAGDDWYEIRYYELEDVDPPRSRFGPKVDAWQFAVNEFLNGKKLPNGHHQWSTFGYVGRVFMFTIIISNVLAVILESVPRIDKAVGNQPGNFFDRFEAFSVFVFLTEYILRLFCAPKNREALYSSYIYATTFFGIVDFLSTAPWFVQQTLLATGYLKANRDSAKIFRIFRIFRILQLEDFVTAFSLLDNVFRASKDVLKATGLMALIIWVGSGALFFIFEENNPNWRACDESIPLQSNNPKKPGCYDFATTTECNEFYPDQCTQSSFANMPDSLFYTAVFLGGEWGVVDFTWPGRFVCMFLCVCGIAIYAIPIGTLFDSFGAVVGLSEDDEDVDEEGDEDETGEDD